MTTRPVLQWLLLWGILIGSWIALEHWAPQPPWFKQHHAVLPLQPNPVKPLPVAIAGLPSSSLDGHQPHALHDSVWTFLDTLSGDLPSDWALQGNATAWFSLHRFFSALSTAKDRRVEVYHWGDSQIEGDRITNVLREAWQTQWGGRGPGWVLPLAPAPNTSIVASLEGDMVRHAGFGRGRDLTALRLPFFAVNEALDTVSWSVKGNVKSSPTHTEWTCSDLWSVESSMGMRLEGQDQRDLVQPTWRHKPTANRMTYQIPPQHVQGFFLGTDKGVMVHNIPLRGASGTLFDNVPDKDWKKMVETHPPAMVILQFGGNAVPGMSSPREARWYAKRLAANIAFIRAQVPSAVVLFIGPSDMGATAEDFPGLSWVVDAIQAEVPRTGVLLWDLQRAMGGPGSMARWVERGWASADHVHFTRQGAKEVGRRLVRSLHEEWRNMRGSHGANPALNPTTRP